MEKVTAPPPPSSLLYKPRWYQEEAVESVFEYFAANTGNPIIACPTGTGKSLIIAFLIKRILENYPGQRILLATHRKKLIQQNADKLLKIWPLCPLGIYSAGLKRKEAAYPIVFGGIASMVKHASHIGHRDLMLIDECHLVSPKGNVQYNRFIAALKQINPYLKVIGLTATQYRLGLGLLTDGTIFTDTCYDITDAESFARLIGEGYLAPLVTQQTKLVLDTEGVKKRGHEFVLKDLQSSVNKTSLTLVALQEALPLLQGREKILVFTTGIAHTEDTVEILQRLGQSAGMVHSKMKDSEAEAQFEAFEKGNLRFLVSGDILTTGIDIPDVDAIVVLRPTMSPVLWVQLLGRGTRPFPGKEDCLVLDFARNIEKLGPIDDPIIPKKKGKKANQKAPVKVCPGCFKYVPASTRYCKYCGHEFIFETKLKATASTGTVMLASQPRVPPPPREIVDFPVNYVTYQKHTKKKTGSVTLKITYHCGLRMFSEWIPIEHKGSARGKALLWWKRVGTGKTCPSSVDDVLTVTASLCTPSNIKVWVNKKYPEVVGYLFNKERKNATDEPF